ncbi:MAG: type IV toxin-antitoxin system AbiEi family antitoxin [Burkholderiales bacterium]
MKTLLSRTTRKPRSGAPPRVAYGLADDAAQPGAAHPRRHALDALGGLLEHLRAQRVLDRLLARGRAYFSREDALRALSRTSDSLTAAAFHGASHQAAMVFQVIVPRQLRDLVIGRHRLEFLTQAPHAFTKANRAEWLAEMKTDAGYARAAGVELTLLDCARYFHRAGGISSVAQVTKDLGARAHGRRLAGHEAQARALEPFAQEAKSVKLLDPSSRLAPGEMSGRWKITVNWPK